MAADGADDGAWFAPKRYGYGVGLPIRWQGWALVAGIVAAVAAIQRWVPQDRIGTPAWLLLIVVAGGLWIAAQHTRGGWRWRWGGE